MRCPFCGHLEDKVVDSRESRERDSIRRRRECLGCNRRFTSYERVEEIPILLVKKDGRREPFEREKLLKGMQAACQKRPVSFTKLEEIATDIQAQLLEMHEREISSRALGDIVMDALKQVDSVAYVRFASIYRDFKDLPDFVAALEGLMAGQVMRAQASLPAASALTPLLSGNIGAPPAKRPSHARRAQQAMEAQVLPVLQEQQKSPTEGAETAPEILIPEPTPLFPGLTPTCISPSRRRKTR